jgi:hypothetical protein
MFRQLCYLSTARGDVNDAGLQAIIDQARSANGPQDITGLLACGGGLFFQILEGPDAAIGALLSKLQADPRHAHLRVLQDITIDRRDFAGWPMAVRCLEPDGARLVAARLRHAPMNVAEILPLLGHTAESSGQMPLPLAA